MDDGKKKHLFELLQQFEMKIKRGAASAILRKMRRPRCNFTHKNKCIVIITLSRVTRDWRTSTVLIIVVVVAFWIDIVSIAASTVAISI